MKTFKEWLIESNNEVDSWMSRIKNELTVNTTIDGVKKLLKAIHCPEDIIKKALHNYSLFHG